MYSNTSAGSISGGSGAEAWTSTGTTGQTGSVDESRESLDTWDATFSWDDTSWQIAQTWSGQSKHDLLDQRMNTWSNSSTTGDFASGNGSYSESSGKNTTVELIHGETQSQGKKLESSDLATGVTWTQESSGTATNWRELTVDNHYDGKWGNASDDG